MEINTNNKIISIPKKFLISQSVIKDFINEKEIEYPYPNILKLYCSSLPNFEYFKKIILLLLTMNKKNKF